MTGPIQAIETGLYSLLAAGTALTTELGGTFIYNKIAPPGTNLPVVIFQWQGGGDENMTPGRQRNPVYTVKGVATTQAEAVALDGHIDTLLHHATLTVAGYTNIWTAREEDVDYIETDTGGNAVYHIGGVYRIRLTQ
jgi:hypothetical protein